MYNSSGVMRVSYRIKASTSQHVQVQVMMSYRIKASTSQVHVQSGVMRVSYRIKASTSKVHVQ